MDSEASPSAETGISAEIGNSRRTSRRQRWSLVLFVAATGYLAVAYVFAPAVWKRYERRHPELDASPRITVTGDGHPGDPLNVALIGSAEDLKSILQAAGWHAAAALSVKSDVEIAVDTVLKRADNSAPVSNLFLFGRKEDLAYEQPVGGNPRQRHHVRFWKLDQPGSVDRPTWIGAATYDERVGFSHTTGQITHHIAADVDVERGHLFSSLEKTGLLTDQQVIAGFHPIREGKNGGGDAWRTDGDLWVGTVSTDEVSTDKASLPPQEPVKKAE